MAFPNSKSFALLTLMMYHFLSYLRILDCKPLFKFHVSFLDCTDIYLFSRLKRLQKLELRDNCLSSLPDTFGDLTNLEFLDLGGNDFVTLVCIFEHILFECNLICFKKWQYIDVWL